MNALRARGALLALASLALSSGSFAQTVWHVHAAAPPGGDGLSWPTAMNTLQSALDVAGTSDQIWVAVGTYHPTKEVSPGNPRSAQFVIDAPVKIFGGFLGGETLLSERDPELFDDTVLSGDIGVPGDPSDNTFRLLSLVTFSIPGVVKVDGFRVTGGNAVGSGGAVFCRLQGGPGYNPQVNLVNCTLDGNHAKRGGAVASEDFGVVRLIRCLVEGNTADTHGAGAYSRTGAVIAINTEFVGNVAVDKGGAYFADSTIGTQVIHVNCVFRDNEARLGGAIFLAGGDFFSGVGSWHNCTFADNVALESGGGLYAVTATGVPAMADVSNSVFWNNAAPSDPQIRGTGLDVSFTDVQGGYPGTGNIDVDPLFLLPARPVPGSPVNDAGSNALLIDDFLDLDGDGDKNEPLPFDFLDRLRRQDDPLAPDTGEGTARIVDMGAFEATYLFPLQR